MTPVQTFGVNAGVNAATAGINAGFGILGSYLANKWARESADHDREENYKYNEMSAENADVRTRALYADLYSPSAQLQQLKDAGLSPSVFYANGAGGISGSTGAQGEGASGVHQSVFGVPNTPISPIDMSQIELNKANARNINAEAQERERTMSERIDRWFLENQNLEIRNTYMKWDTALKRLEYGLKEQYEPQKYEAEINQIAEQTKLIGEQIRNERVKGNINEATENQQIETIKNKNVQLLADIALKRAQKQLTNENVQLTKAQVEELYNRVIQNWTSLGIEQGKLDFEKKKLQEIVKQWGKQNGFTERQLNQGLGKLFIEGMVAEQKMILETATLLVKSGGI